MNNNNNNKYHNSDSACYKNAIRLMNDNKEQHTTNVIYTYFDDIGVGNSMLLESWTQSWKRNGWIPIVLDQSIAKLHPFYSLLYEQFDKFPTVNSKAYEMSCYLRWVAMAVVGGGYLSDYDTLNMDFPPPDTPPTNFTIYQGAVPALVSASQQEYERILNELALFKLDPTRHVYDDKPHISDMYIFLELSGSNKVITTTDLITSHKIVHLSTRHVTDYAQRHHIQNLDKVSMAQIILNMNKEEFQKISPQFGS
jgi:hypothetical protein